MAHVLISGGSRGIGRACVSLFLSKGYDVSYLFLHSKGDSPSGVNAIRCDVSDSSDVKNAVSEAVSRFGDIDILISNSGVSLTGLATDFGDDEYRLVMDTNFGGLYNLAKEVIPSMVRNRKGVITATSSMWGQTGASCEALYSASKGAVDAYIKSLAKELGPSGIRVNAVSPGVIETDMMKSFTESDKDVLKEETPLGRLGTPEEVASLIYYLSSDEASFITGQIIGINGGFLI